MMVGVIRGADGAILGQHAVDPTAPGGIQAQLQQIAAQAQRGPMPQGGPQVPQPNTMMAQAFLRFPVRLPNGQMQWVTRAIATPPELSIPPGVYMLMPPGTR